ncbi:MAG: YIP1 family protein [Ignavibacteriales bacterium]|nr:YIP1 family protein [Ignavibacteriales bacterium]
MIICPVCETENQHLAINCSKCRGYLQQKIETLDLFSIAWLLIESPKKAFHKIAIATHKNYIIFLSAIAGVGLLFSTFWFYKIGDHVSSLLKFLGIGISSGLIFGQIFILLLSLIVWLIFKIEKRSVKFRQVFAVSAYSSIPIIISVIILLPLEVLTFGTYFFATNPSPYLLKPFSYIVLLGLDFLFGLWSFILLGIGINKLRDGGWIRSFLIEIVSLGILCSIIHYFFTTLIYNIYGA